MKLIIMTISWVQFSGIKYIHGVLLGTLSYPHPQQSGLTRSGRAGF